jgi:hypothetical protein
VSDVEKLAIEEEQKQAGTGSKPGGPPPKNQRARKARGKALRGTLLAMDLEASAAARAAEPDD